MAKIGVSDFQIRDVINPQPKRTRRFLSSLFNFWTFFDSQIEKYDEISKKAMEAKEEQLRLQSAIESYKREINHIKKKTMEEEPLCKQIQEEMDANHVVLEQLSRETKQLKEKFATVKFHGTEVASNNVDLALKIQKAKQENAALAAQIVHSPERLKEEVVQETQRLDGLVEEKRQLQLRLQELVEHRECLKGFHTTMLTFHENMTNIAEQLDLERDLDRRLKEARTNTKRLQQELSDKRTQLSDLNELLKTKQERRAALEVQHAAKMNSLKQKLKSLQSDAETLEQFQTERDIVLADLVERQEAVLKEIDAVNKKADDNDAHIKSQLSDLLSEVDEFNRNMLAEITEMDRQMTEGRLADEEEIRRLEMWDVFEDDRSS